VAETTTERALEARQAADDGGVVAEQAVAVQLEEVVEAAACTSRACRALGMARQLRALPGGQAGVGALA
jgi:hypothetical protein